MERRPASGHLWPPLATFSRMPWPMEIDNFAGDGPLARPDLRRFCLPGPIPQLRNYMNPRETSEPQSPRAISRGQDRPEGSCDSRILITIRLRVLYKAILAGRERCGGPGWAWAQSEYSQVPYRAGCCCQPSTAERLKK